MMGPKPPPRSPEELRVRALEKWRDDPARGAQGRPEPLHAPQLVHELQVHQIELELQNEELVESRAEVEDLLERYTDLFESAPVGYLTLDVAGTVQQLNRTAAALLGGDRAPAIHRALGEWLAPGDQPAWSRLLRAAFAGEGPAPTEWVLGASREGPPTTVELTFSAISGRQECRVVLVDVTERRRVETRLRASQKLEAIGRLAGGVAHDFNNLLAVIVSHVEFGQKAVAPGSSAHDDFEVVRMAAARAEGVVRQLLAFGSREKVAQEILDLHQVVTGLSILVQGLVGDAVALGVKTEGPPAWFAGNRNQVEQIVTNLAANARDAMPAGGTLTLTVSTVELTGATSGRYLGAKPGRYVLLTVTDTGGGMDAAAREHLFEPFFTTKGLERGAGLGLSTVYGIVEHSGGDLAVQSVRGRGTSFQIYLPAAAAPAVPQEKAPVRRTVVGGTETIVVVEDEEPLRRIVKRILSAAGYTVLTAANGSEALTVCAEHPGPIHLALSDILMPRMTGPAFIERLLTLRPTTRVLYMSGYPGDALDSLREPRPEVVAKPFTPERLQESVRRALDAK